MHTAATGAVWRSPNLVKLVLRGGSSLLRLLTHLFELLLLLRERLAQLGLHRRVRAREGVAAGAAWESASRSEWARERRGRAWHGRSMAVWRGARLLLDLQVDLLDVVRFRFELLVLLLVLVVNLTPGLGLTLANLAGCPQRATFNDTSDAKCTQTLLYPSGTKRGTKRGTKWGLVGAPAG